MNDYNPEPLEPQLEIGTTHREVKVMLNTTPYALQFANDNGLRKAFRLDNAMETYDLDKFIEDNKILSELLMPQNIIYRAYGHYTTQTYYHYDKKKKLFTFSEYDVSANKEGEVVPDLSRVDVYSDLSDPDCIKMIDSIQEDWLKSKKHADEPHKIKLVVSQGPTLRTQEYPLTNVPKFDLKYYNEGFETFHKQCTEDLKESKGLTLFHGPPGTGKTTYIKMLTDIVKDRKFIFIPPSMSTSLSDPSLIPLLLDNTNSILVIEDAEDCLTSRDGGGHKAAVSNILNMTDGILSDILNIHIIATFNTDIHRVDEALRRPGRLKNSYEFKALTADRIKALTGQKDSKEMTVATLMNGEVKFVKEKRSKVGF